ncbi:lytic transglycosylase domain-containing protein [Candidatus Pelagibacter sp.]|nr:lytic transglycosylase domain-containing protein [Candidatus Pelagibacter sp.]MDC3020329.1 lytic transglycosylase domain-containing protein [Candidatus Pelagibacter sp.]
MHLKLLTTIILFFLSFQSAFSNETILPIKKPDLNEKNTTKKIADIIPLPKPSEKEDEIQKEIKITTTEIFKKIDGVIIPKNKPLIVKEKLRKIKKQKFYSDRDMKYAKQAISFMEKSNWKDAKKAASKARAKSIYDFIQWRHLLTTGNRATFTEYKQFIERVKDYPRIDRVRYLGEHKINSKNHTKNEIIQWFDKYPPLSGFGKMMLGDALLSKNKETAINLIKEGFIKADLSKNDLIFFRKKFKKYLNSSDYIKRADYLAWENKYWDLKRMLRYLPKDYQLLYTARQLLMSRSYGVDSAISNVPASLKKDAGLNYDRLKWRRKRGRVDSSLEILLSIKNNKDYMVRPDKWWVERSIIARSLIYKKRYEQAYKITSKHGLSEGAELAEAEWMSGWIALSFLKDPILAKSHFTKFYNNVGYPISLSRGAYWLGKANLALNNKEEADKWFKEGSKYLTTYYGQLSHMKIYPNKTFELKESTQVDKNYAESFYKNKLVAIVHLLDEVKKDKYTKHILRFLANDNVSAGSEILAAKLATDISRFDFAIQVSKIASYQKRFHNKYNYPVISTPNKVGSRKIPEQALILSIIRQESEFDISARSRVGAQGLMQLMPYTAKTVAKQAKVSYSKSRLTTSPEYNINLGSFYIAGLILDYDGSYPFAVAAYNAGPKRVKYWKKINKDPQKKQIDYVDWVELIKFKETRNYVQRVMENYNVYRYILSQKPIFLKDFFRNNPLY